MFNLIDYKGKHYIIQDKDYNHISDFGYTDYIVGEISKEEALKPEYIKQHESNCNYYGIPCYVGDDKEMLEAYNSSVEGELEDFAHTEDIHEEGCGCDECELSCDS